MKSSLEFRQGLRRRFSGAAATIVLAHAFALTSLAQPASPVGSWDMLSSGGGQKGIVFITFNDDFTFNGEQLQAPVNFSSGSIDERGLVSGETRDGSSTGGSTKTNLFGFSLIGGPWSYDSQGHVVGNFTALIELPSGSGNFVTNAASFVGKAVPGKRLTLVASTSFGKVAYRGTPATNTLPDISGSWYGFKTQNDQSFLEFFTLANSPFQNIYFISGQGPGYTYDMGICMLSSHKKIGFSLVEVAGGSTNGLLRATIGSFVNKSTIGAKTKGIIEPGTKVRFDATRQ